MESMESYEHRLKNGELLKTAEVEEICRRAIEILIDEPNIISIDAPVKICGDIHAQFYDLLNIFKIHGSPKMTKFIFLGDYVDRGFHGIETFSLLLVYKIMYPKNIILLRGNHETYKISKSYGFYDEVMLKYENFKIWRLFCDVFSFLNLGCIVSGRIFCVHGGISERTNTISNLQQIDRFKIDTDNNLIGDLLWSDPYDTYDDDNLEESYNVNSNRRGTGCNFGNNLVRTFCEFNDFIRIVRSHQLARQGYKINFTDKSCVTIWSAPNYCYRYGNLGAVYDLTENLKCEEYNFKVFKEVENQKPGFESVVVLKRNKFY